MNQFLQATKQMINLHGQTISYVKIINGTYDPNTGSVSNTSNSTSIKAYAKDLKANQFNYPNLVGKHALLIYIPGDSLVDVPSVNDKVTIGSNSYTIDSVQSHSAFGEVCLYRLIAVKG
jgi:hypothetical protein